MANPFSELIELDGNRFAHMRHRLSGKMPDGWVLKETPPQFMFRSYIVGLGMPNSNTDPIIAIRFLGSVSTNSFSEYTELAERAEPQGAISCTTLDVLEKTDNVDRLNMNCTTIHCPVHIEIYIRDGIGYAVELWSNDQDKYKEALEGFLASIDWHYVHEPRTLGEFIASSNANNSRQESANAHALKIALGALIFLAALALYSLHRQ